MKTKAADDAPIKFMGQYFSIQSANFYSYPVELQKEILETEKRLLKKKATVTELERFVESNPDIPEYKILLFLVYDYLGLSSRSVETALQTVNEHPGYLAGRCYLGFHYVLKNESEKALQLFNGFVELGELFSERTEFLSTEEDDYLFMGIVYFSSVSNIPPAARRLKAIKNRNPDYLLLNLAETVVDHARMNRNIILFEEWEPKRRNVEYVDRSLPQGKGMPTFENPEINEFYNHDLSFDSMEINRFLTLPHESFIRDLEKVILDSRQRYQHFFYEDDDLRFPDNANTRFLIHAVLFLTECRAEGSLTILLGLLEEDEPFYYDWFDEYFEECMVPAIYHLGQHQLEALKNFMLIPNLVLFPRDAVAHAVSSIALHQPERRGDVVKWFDEVFQYFIDHREDDGIIDTDLNGSMLIYCTQIKALELLETIKTMFDLDLVSIDFCGPFDDVEADLSRPVSDHDIQPVFTIFEQYEYFRGELEDQFNDVENDDDPDLAGNTKRDKSLGGSFRLSDERPQMPIIAEKTPGRNDPCPCGSGKKYKKCCLNP